MKPGLSILLVEDEALIAMDLRFRLLKAGAGRCQMVATGEEAVAWAAQDRFDAIVMDNHLAGAVDGVEAAARIRAVGPVPIVFITGYPKDDAYVDKIRALHPCVGLEKPLDFTELLAAIESLVP